MSLRSNRLKNLKCSESRPGRLGFLESSGIRGVQPALILLQIHGCSSINSERPIYHCQLRATAKPTRMRSGDLERLGLMLSSTASRIRFTCFARSLLSGDDCGSMDGYLHQQRRQCRTAHLLFVATNGDVLFLAVLSATWQQDHSIFGPPNSTFNCSYHLSHPLKTVQNLSHVNLPRSSYRRDCGFHRQCANKPVSRLRDSSRLSNC
jgi:hypothetical protein